MSCYIWDSFWLSALAFKYHPLFMANIKIWWSTNMSFHTRIGCINRFVDCWRKKERTQWKGRNITFQKTGLFFIFWLELLAVLKIVFILHPSVSHLSYHSNTTKVSHSSYQVLDQELSDHLSHHHPTKHSWLQTWWSVTAQIKIHT